MMGMVFGMFNSEYSALRLITDIDVHQKRHQIKCCQGLSKIFFVDPIQFFFVMSRQ